MRFEYGMVYVDAPEYGACNVDVMLPEQEEVDSGAEPYLAVIIGEDPVPFFGNLRKVLEASCETEDDREALAEWLEHWAEGLRT